MWRSKSDFGRKGSRNGSLSQLCDWDRTYRYFPLFTELSPYHCLSLSYCRVLIPEVMVTYLNDRMVNTRNGRGDLKPAQPNENPPLPPTLTQVIASILDSRDEQTELVWQMMANSARGGHRASNSSSDYIRRLHSHSPAVLHRGGRASRGRSLALGDRVQV
jgi:hypothetical protein